MRRDTLIWTVYVAFSALAKKNKTKKNMSADGHSSEKWTEPQFGMCAAGRQDDRLDDGLERQSCSEDQVATQNQFPIYPTCSGGSTRSSFCPGSRTMEGFFLSSSNTVQPLIWALIHRPCILLHNLSIQHSETHTSLAPEKRTQRTQCAKFYFLYFFLSQPPLHACIVYDRFSCTGRQSGAGASPGLFREMVESHRATL